MKKVFEILPLPDLYLDIKQVLYFMKIAEVKIKYFILSIVLTIFLTFFSLYTVSLIFPLADGIIKGNFDSVKNIKIIGNIAGLYPDFFSSSIHLFVLLVIWIYMTVIIKNILQYGAFLSTHYQAKNASARLRSLLLNKYLSFGKSFYDKNSISSVYNTLTRSTGLTEGQFKLLLNLFIQFLLVVAYLSVMFFLSWKLTLISMIVFPIVNQFTKSIIKKIKILLTSAEQSLDNLNDQFLNILYCMPIIKGFAKEQYEKELFDLASERDIEKSFKIYKLRNLMGPVQDIGDVTSTLLIAFGMAVILYYEKTIDPAKTLVFFFLASKIGAFLGALNNFKIEMIVSSIEVKKIIDLLESGKEFVIQSGSRKIEKTIDNIELRDLSFSYNNSMPTLLKNINIHFKKGETVAIVGPSGSGKSTIANLLLRFYDCPKDSIFINGIDVMEYDINSLRRHITFVDQDSLLFNTTVNHNILYGSHEFIHDDKMTDLSRKTTVHNFVSKLTNGYKTKISDRGANFSGGERQRISITRALLKESDVVILDEATSSLDSSTEKIIMNLFGELKKEKIFIVILHKLSTIRSANQIVYIEDGKVIEQGNFDELISMKGQFYKQWENQKLIN